MILARIDGKPYGKPLGFWKSPKLRWLLGWYNIHLQSLKHLQLKIAVAQHPLLRLVPCPSCTLAYPSCTIRVEQRTLDPIAAYCNLHVHHVPELSRNWNQTGRWPKNEQPILMWKLDVSTPLPINSIAFMDRCDKAPLSAREKTCTR